MAKLRSLRVHVDHDTPYVLMDMDTPQDYTRCLAEFRRRAVEPHARAERPRSA